MAAAWTHLADSRTSGMKGLIGGGEGSGGRRTIKNRPGARGGRGIGVVMRIRSWRASSPITSSTSAAGRWATLPKHLLLAPSSFPGDDMTLISEGWALEGNRRTLEENIRHSEKIATEEDWH